MRNRKNFKEFGTKLIHPQTNQVFDNVIVVGGVFRIDFIHKTMTMEQAVFQNTEQLKNGWPDVPIVNLFTIQNEDFDEIFSENEDAIRGIHALLKVINDKRLEIEERNSQEQKETIEHRDLMHKEIIKNLGIEEPKDKLKSEKK